MSFDQIVGGAVAVIVAGMPAMIALLKINRLHVIVNSRVEKLIEATSQVAEHRLSAMTRDRDAVVRQNEQLMQRLAEITNQINELPVRCSADRPQP